MPESLDNQFYKTRNGTSQAQRLLEALKTDHALVDERTIKDFLHFSQQFGSQLRYYNQQNVPDGLWTGLLGLDDSLIDRLALYAEDPDLFADDAFLDELTRPHLVLLLAFLKLQREFPQEAINQFTKRHLDYYFQDILQIQPKDTEPDHVHVVVELAKSFKDPKLFLPATTALDGGKDSDGNPLIYETQHDLMINRGQVAQIKTVFVDKTEERVADYSFSRDFMYMMALAYGENNEGTLTPAGALPLVDFLLADLQSPVEPEEDFFKIDLVNFLEFPDRAMSMNLVVLRKLVRLKQNRDHDLNEWALINEELLGMADALGRTVSSFTDPRDFILNFTDATGTDPVDPTFFSVLQNVNDIYELYEELDSVLSILSQEEIPNQAFYEGRRDDLTTFIHEHYYNDPGNPDLDDTIGDFLTMMRLRWNVREDWREILEIVEETAPTANLESLGNQFLELPSLDDLLVQAYQLSDPSELTAFFQGAHPTVTSLDEYHEDFLLAQEYFGLTGEEILTLLSGEEVHQYLEKGHQNKYAVKRRQLLRQIREDTGFVAMMRWAFGDTPGDALPQFQGAPPNFEAFYNVVADEGADPQVLTAVEQYITQQLYLSVEDFGFIMEVQLDESALPDSQAPPWQWEQVYRLIGKAEELKRFIKAPEAPLLTTLNGVKVANDATTTVVGGEEEDYPRWKTFGAANLPEARLGLMVASPLLNLAGGDRTIILDIYLDDASLTAEQQQSLIDLFAPEQEQPPFNMALSGEEDWVVVAPGFTYRAEDYAINVQLSLSADREAVLALPPDHPDYVSGIPALRLTLAQPDLYAVFSEIQYLDAELAVMVDNLLPAVLRNDQTLLKAGEPIEPWGTAPKTNSKFSFTHPEVASKRLETLRINVPWMGLPNFAANYINYSGSGNLARTNSANFQGVLRMNDLGVVRSFGTPEGEDTISLFTGGDQKSIAIDGNFTSDVSYHHIDHPIVTDNVFDSDRYFYFQLGRPDFGHAEYPGLAARKANELAVDIASEGNPQAASFYEVNPPYTPQLETFTFGYTARETNIFAEDFDGQTAFYHLHPFGRKQSNPAGDYIVPRYPNEGELYIGISGFEAPADLSMLFQLAEGSANPDVLAPALFWDYLQDDEWIRLEEGGNLLTDTTNGLLNSGIIKIRIPEAANETHQLMPSGLRWLKVIAESNSDGLSDTINIHTQAVLATLKKDGVAATHFQQPLPPETIKKLVKRTPEIKGVIQPYSSFGGRPEEPEENLEIRISERLRHKNRAVNIWDYERLVLEHFPQVYRVKCVPGGSAEVPDLGKVELIVVPNIRGLRPFDPFEPKLPLRVLNEIAEFLTAQASESAEITVHNPTYFLLRIRMSVELYPDYQSDVQFYLDQLHQGLLRLLAPWAYDEGAELVIGGRFFPSMIIDYVEQQFYIDYIKDFKLLYGEQDNLKPASELQLQKGLEVPRPNGIWVSARDHLLDASGVAGRGVGYMKVDVDLVVG